MLGSGGVEYFERVLCAFELRVEDRLVAFLAECGGKGLRFGGHDEAVVQRIWCLLEMAEYKRRQAPPGVKLTSRAFGRDRRYPITNAFRGKA